ncbi:MAG TPA: long-chain fatty acid--CoA ligase, partial [Bacteroidia bacterium]|nr:long-chain fatty acid--CoA ligase [Bacteroidia bacterium]
MIRRLFDIPQRQLELFPKKDALVAKINGNWVPTSTEKFIETADLISQGLLSLGLKKGDKIGLMSANRPEWNIMDIGMMQIGVVNVPIYTTLSENEIAFILNDCQAKLMFVGDASLLEKINHIRSKVPTLTEVYSFDQIAGAKNWNELVEKGKATNNSASLNSIKDSISPDDLATLLYTSGTTGTPKGVMLSHNNIVSNILSSEHLCPVDQRHWALSFLPLCHSYERMLTYLYIFLGVSIYYAESIEKIGDNLREIKPHVFSTVPRLLEKVFDRIVDKGKELSGIKKMLFFWALDLGLKYELKSKNGSWYEAQLKLANKLIFSKWREALGGNVKVIVSGGAALQPRLARVFWAAKIHVLEGYGLTETSPVIAVNNLEERGAMFGTVGPVIKGVEVKFAQDGEILCKGPNVMLGYYNRPDLTAEVMDQEGYFHTGDIGVMMDNHFLKITDRKKEIFKTSGGKYIAPQALENKFKESSFIEQIMVIGENRKFPSALIVPNFAHLKKWCEIKGMPFTNPEDMILHQEVIDRIGKEVEDFNKDFGQTEQIKKFALLSKEWTIDSGELTATLKLRRKIIQEKFSA